MTTVANPTLGKIEDLFKTLVWDSLVKAGMEAILVQVPGLRVWPLSALTRYVIGTFSEKLYGVTKLAVDLQAISFLNGQHKRAFDRAAVTLKIIANEKGIESEEFRKAKDEAKSALSQFVRFHGV